MPRSITTRSRRSGCPRRCAFVDDLLPNVLAARELRTGRDPPHRHPTTASELDILFDRAVALSTSRAQLTRRPRPPALPDVGMPAMGQCERIVVRPERR